MKKEEHSDPASVGANTFTSRVVAVRGLGQLHASKVFEGFAGLQHSLQKRMKEHPMPPPVQGRIVC